MKRGITYHTVEVHTLWYRVRKRGTGSSIAVRETYHHTVSTDDPVDAVSRVMHSYERDEVTRITVRRHYSADMNRDAQGRFAPD